MKSAKPARPNWRPCWKSAAIDSRNSAAKTTSCATIKDSSSNVTTGSGRARNSKETPSTSSSTSKAGPSPTPCAFSLPNSPGHLLANSEKRPAAPAQGPFPGFTPPEVAHPHGAAYGTPSEEQRRGLDSHSSHMHPSSPEHAKSASKPHRRSHFPTTTIWEILRFQFGREHLTPREKCAQDWLLIRRYSSYLCSESQVAPKTVRVSHGERKTKKGRLFWA